MESAQRSSRAVNWRKLLRALSIGVGSFFAVLIGGLLLLMWGCEPPSLQTLERRFPQQRRDLETIVSMSDHDSQLTRIDPTWLMMRDGRQFLGYSPESGITRERWDEYRRLFSRNGIAQGIQRDPEKGDAFIIVDSIGLLNRGHSTAMFIAHPVQTTSIRRAYRRHRPQSTLTNLAMKPIPFTNWLTDGTRQRGSTLRQNGTADLDIFL